MEGIEKKIPLFEIKYSVSENDYIGFTNLILNGFMAEKKKKSYIISSLMVFISILLFVQIMVSKRYNHHLLIFLVFFGFCMGVYNLLFYTKIFPKSLEKNAKKAYQTTKFSKGEIELNFFDGFLIEKSAEGEVEIPFSSIEKKEENEQLIVIFYKNKHIVIINKEYVSKELLDFLRVKV